MLSRSEMRFEPIRARPEGVRGKAFAVIQAIVCPLRLQNKRLPIARNVSCVSSPVP